MHKTLAQLVLALTRGVVAGDAHSYAPIHATADLIIIYCQLGPNDAGPHDLVTAWRQDRNYASAADLALWLLME